MNNVKPANTRNNTAAPLNERHDQILEKAAHLFCIKGYEATSMSDIANEVGITKAGLYYFVDSKEHLLYLITDYGLDLLDEMVISPLHSLKKVDELLHELIARHVHMVLHRPLEVTVILHERTALTGDYRKRILQRKKSYIQYVRDIMKRLQDEDLARLDMDPTAATFFLLGALNWIYQWYKAEGQLTENDLVRELTNIFDRGFLK